MNSSLFHVFLRFIDIMGSSLPSNNPDPSLREFVFFWQIATLCFRINIALVLHCYSLALMLKTNCNE